MSILATYKIVCDMCGEGLRLEKYVLSGGVTHPEVSKAFKVELHGMRMDLCPECYGPLIEARDRRVAELIRERRYVGFPDPEKFYNEEPKCAHNW